MVGTQYEFTPAQEESIRDLAKKMQFVGFCLIVGGALACLTVFARNFVGLASGVLNILMGVWTQSAAASFGRIVKTQGHDIGHLMDAVGELRKMYKLQIVRIVIAVVALVGIVLFTIVRVAHH